MTQVQQEVAQEVAQESKETQSSQLQIQDLQIVTVALGRALEAGGAFKAAELQTIGAAYNNIVNFLSNALQQIEQQKAQ